MCLHVQYGGLSYVKGALLVVGLAMLAVLIYPVFAPHHHYARQSICTSNLRQLALAVMMQAQDADNRLLTLPADRAWTRVLGAYAFNGICDCPSNDATGTMAAPDYGFNANLSGQHIKRIADPSTLLLLADLHRTRGNSAAALRNWETDLGTPHNGGALVAAVDGHVGYISFQHASTKRAALLNAGTVVELPQEGSLMDRVQVIGVYTVEETADVFLIEVIVQASADEFEMDQFMQEMPGKPQGYWQAAYDEHYLTPDGDKVIGMTFHRPLTGRRPTRVAFFLHFVDFSRPMLTPFEPISLPQPSPMPERLAQLMKYEEPD